MYIKGSEEKQGAKIKVSRGGLPSGGLARAGILEGATKFRHKEEEEWGCKADQAEETVCTKALRWEGTW